MYNGEDAREGGEKMDSRGEGRERSFFLTFMTVISCVAVVILHANGVFWSFSYERVWLTANMLESVFYFAVPVFFMISGSTLLDYRDHYDTRTYAIKRVKKTVIPFLAWSLVALAFQLILKGYTFETVTVYTVVDTILNSRHWGVYWFFMPLFGAYLAIPVFSLIPKERRKSIFPYIIAVGYLFNELIPFVNRLLGNVIPVSGELGFPISRGYLLYLFVGYYIYHYQVPLWLRRLTYVLGAAGLAVHMVGTWYCSYQAGEIVTLFKGYMNLPCFFYSTALFLFFRNVNYQKWNRRVTAALNYLSTETFNVYLIHMFVITGVSVVFKISWTSFVSRTVGAVAVFLVVTLICKQVKKLPLVRIVLP